MPKTTQKVAIDELANKTPQSCVAKDMLSGSDKAMTHDFGIVGSSVRRRLGYYGNSPSLVALSTAYLMEITT